jgi:hypothetical protein
MKEEYDGAEPAPSSISVLNLLMLSHLVDDPAWPPRIEATLKLFGTRLERLGRAVPMMAAALSTYVAGVQQIVIVHPEAEGVRQLEREGDRQLEREGDRQLEREGFSRALARRYLPFAVILDVPPDRRSRLAASLPFLAPMTAVDGRAAVYVCRDFACRQPVTTSEALEQELGTFA